MVSAVDAWGDRVNMHMDSGLCRWRGRPSKLSGVAAAGALADRDIRIAELESQVALLTASHVAMIRAVGELGGFSKWAQFYDSYDRPYSP
jgi:hypothetical protein